ncbi:hypothetical protein PHMEG_00030837 [Phytophthora megakarya]|uniref:Uncharacterized protein n=1 Tax=Phytophthora megakarya TaxID=4795 RepID=A0A225V1W0_9STRA|nr:hypothetical protein PHMEG_00030837 [Phytophthora megakarya]
MSELAFITLLNCAVRDLNRNGSSASGYVRQEWRDIWFTSHTFRRAGAQYRFMFAAPERRWSLRMVKWWAGWTQNESAETLVRYLLDQAVTDEDKQLADCLAPDRELHLGCPTTYSDWKDMYRMYWTAEPFRHLFKPVSEWTAEDKKKSGALPSRLSVAKLIAQDVLDFAVQNGIENLRAASEDVLSKYAGYYMKYRLRETTSSTLTVLTIDTLARYIRLDRKRRLIKSQHAYLSP